jgi:DNA-directed RNA polymerase I and III subunit RPAC1
MAVSVESSGQFDSDEIFLASVGTLKAKCTNLKRDIYRMLRKQALDAKRSGEQSNPNVDTSAVKTDAA